jgi:formylglycine-generating enzyme required for sulfatase activity
LAHEEQHQELLLTDILHLFSRNATLPAYDPAYPSPISMAEREKFIPIKGGEVVIGAKEGSEFCFDNETPRHISYLQDYEMSSRLVSNGDWIEFIQDKGYSRPELWLSEGWSIVKNEKWEAPLYWTKLHGLWRTLTLNGVATVDPKKPVEHVSYFEADAYAR